jgi:hypothetical protein
MTISKQKKEIDDKQNEKISQIDVDISTIKKGLIELKIMFDSLKKEFVDFVNSYTFKHNLKNKIEIKSETILKSNPVLLQNCNCLVSLLISGRNETINFANYLYFNSIDLNEKTIEREAGAITDRLKLIANNLITDKKSVDGWEITYVEFLKTHTRIKQVLYNLISKIMDYKKGVYNGKSNQKYIDIFENFIEQIYEIAIQSFFEFKNLK